MIVAADYPLLNIFWTIIIVFAWVAWFWVLIMIISDLFSRHDIGGWGKALWMLFVIIVPFLGVFIYLIAEGKSMGERRMALVQESQSSSTPTSARSRPARAPRTRSPRPRRSSERRHDRPGRVRQAQGAGARLTAPSPCGG